MSQLLHLLHTVVGCLDVVERTQGGQRAGGAAGDPHGQQERLPVQQHEQMLGHQLTAHSSASPGPGRAAERALYHIQTADHSVQEVQQLAPHGCLAPSNEMCACARARGVSGRRMQVTVAVMMAPVTSLKHSSSEPLVLLADIGSDTVRARARRRAAPPGWSL